MKAWMVLAIGLLSLYAASFVSSALLSVFSAEGYKEANVLRIVGNTIIIGNNCTAIVADTSPERAQSIQLGLEKTMGDRPNTHDTFATLLNSFNITFESISLDSFDGKFYYSSAIFKSKDKVLKLEMTPSDGIALALRTGGKIYLNNTLLSQVGKQIC